MNRIPRVGRFAVLVGVSVILGACWHRRGSGDDKDELKACPAPAAAPTTWSWKTEKLSDVSIEMPSTFVEHLSGDVRSRTWRDGPREITMRLTSDGHATRRAQSLVGICALEVGDREIEVVETRPDGSTHELLALVPDVPGGPNVLVRVSTPYYKEFDALRRAVSSIQVDEGKGNK